MFLKLFLGGFFFGFLVFWFFGFVFWLWPVRSAKDERSSNSTSKGAIIHFLWSFLTEERLQQGRKTGRNMAFIGFGILIEDEVRRN